MIFGGSESAIISCNKEDESVGNSKPELGITEKSGWRKAKDVDDRDVNHKGEKEGKGGHSFPLLIKAFGFVGFHWNIHVLG